MLTKNFHQLQAKVQRHVKAAHVKQGSDKTGVIGCLAGGKNDPEFIEREYGIPLAVSCIAELIFVEGLPPGEAAAFFAALPDAVDSDGKDLSRVCWQFLAAELRALPAVSAETQAVVAPVIAGLDRLANGLGWPAHEAESASKAAADAAAAANAAAAAAAVYVAAAYAAASAAAAAAAVSVAAADAASAANAAAAAVYVAADDDACADWAYAVANAAVYVAADDAACAVWVAAYAADATALAGGATALAGGDPILSRRRQRDTLLQLIKEAPITTQENN